MATSSSQKPFYLFVACVLAGLFTIASVNLYQAHSAAAHVENLTYSQFLDELQQGHVKSVILKGQSIRGVLASHAEFLTYAADDPELVRELRTRGVSITAVAPLAPSQSMGSVLQSLLPTLLLVGLGIFFFTRMPSSGAAGNRMRDLTKSKAQPLQQDSIRVTFADVAGVDEARDALKEIVDFLRSPDQFQRLGGHIPRGVLLVGPPGTGKTLLARAVAGEANVPFYSISGASFVELFVGVGAARVRDLFEQAKKHAPCIIFMDEIDAVGRRRGAGLGGGNDEREQTLNQLLVEMDGFQSTPGVILIAATNRPDVLDPALLRPGRFDREVTVDTPDVVGRERILRVHARRVPIGSDVDFGAVARGTPGFCGAELMNLVNEAALLAARRAKTTVGWLEFEDAKDTVMMGAERRTHVMSEQERRLTAYREGGRAIVALNMPAADPLHKVTIVTRGRTTGMVTQLPETEQSSLTREQMTARLAILLGGRAAEELVFGRDKVSSGTAGDIEAATKLARLMVTRYGLSDELGPVAYGENQDEVFLGHSVARTQNVAEDTARVIASEIRKLIDTALESAKSILVTHRSQLDALAQVLLRQETLDGRQIRDLLSDAPSQPFVTETSA